MKNLYLLKVHLQIAAASGSRVYYYMLQQFEGELLRDKGFSRWMPSGCIAKCKRTEAL